MAEAEAPRPRGRRPKYQEDYARRAFLLGMKGLTNEQLAAVFDVALPTIELWIRTRPAFATALKAGREDADGNVVRSLYERAMGFRAPATKIFYNQRTGRVIKVPYEEVYPPDPTALIFWLKNRQPKDWRDRATDSFRNGDAQEQARKVRDAIRAMDQADGVGTQPQAQAASA